jgi:hypothetical protein
MTLFFFKIPKNSKPLGKNFPFLNAFKMHLKKKHLKMYFKNAFLNAFKKHKRVTNAFKMHLKKKHLKMHFKNAFLNAFFKRIF